MATAPVAKDPAKPDIPPTQTLYVYNLNEKIKKAALKRALYALFSPLGRVTNVVTFRTHYLRGQAWVSFESVADATTAMRELQGTSFFDKPMRIKFSKEKSHSVVRAEGGVVTKRKRSEMTGGVGPAGTLVAGSVAKKKRVDREGGGGGGGGAGTVEEGSSAVEMEDGGALPTTTEPTATLLAQQVPAEASDMMLRALFGQYAGLKDIRFIPQRGIAFIEYDTPAAALPALQGLHNFRLSDTHAIQLTYAKSA